MNFTTFFMLTAHCEGRWKIWILKIRLLFLISIVCLWWRTLGAPVDGTIRPILDERYRIIYATMRVAIFGSSYVKRASNFTDFVMPFEVGWFGIGGMTASQPCPNLISKMIRYNPDIVVVCLGGNDISSGAEPSTVIDCLTILLEKIKVMSPLQPEIFFTEIVSRGKFRIPLQREEFDTRRRTVNNKMKKTLGRTYIRIDVKFPRHYLADAIHFNEAGTVLFLLSISKTIKSRS